MNILNYTKSIETDLGVFNLSLITKDFVYYVNPTESDENACVIMLDRAGELVSDNYFAYGDYMNVMELVAKGATDYDYIDEENLHYAKEYFSQCN